MKVDSAFELRRWGGRGARSVVGRDRATNPNDGADARHGCATLRGPLCLCASAVGSFP